MKRFVTAMLILGAMALGIYYLYFSLGVYLPASQRGEPELPFRTEGGQFLRKRGEAYEAFEIKGVEVSASLPGHYASEFALEEEDYLRWFEQISSLGANTIKAPALMDADFYRALYTYNTAEEEPLFLLQVIPVEETVNSGPENAYEGSLLQSLIRDGKSAVDMIHGRKTVAAGRMGQGGNYRRDVSQWVAGLVLGNGWDPDTVAYTDHSPLHGGTYEGNYFSAGKEAGAFESMLARAMDEIAAYETEKYAAQHPMGFSNSRETDFLEYEEAYALQRHKYSSLDAEQVEPTENWKAGTFAAYHLSGYGDEFVDYISEDMSSRLEEILRGIDREASYGGYLDLLSAYHSMPVVAVEYGFSTARTSSRQGEAPLTEQEQGERLMEVYRDARKAGWSGVCISTWQDRWDQKSWNTAFAVEGSRRMYWHDLMTEGENYGLLDFEPEGEESCILDGDDGEWGPEDEVLASEGMTLSLRYDYEGLYLLIRGEQVNERARLFVPLDTVRGQGSMEIEEPALTLDREADFLLVIDGRENTRLLVQERYQAAREMFSFEMTGVNPFIYEPPKDSPVFVPIGTAQENRAVLENYLELSPRERREQTAMGMYESGLLRHGNGDPLAAEYDSLADFCFGEHLVEIRIPWLLLNVGDPAGMQAHEDYYEHYGVEFAPVQKIYLGLTGGRKGALVPVRVKGRKSRIQYREREKDSCRVIRREWGGEKTDGTAG